ncbi:MAG: thiamine pyrophosphate-binding protein [Deltaproteobacteria bacterium]|nr:thiamine pyrophosphate-binding protein [Deltaproteobacteria bacterium]
MRVADFVFNFLADYGVKDVFLVTGGGAMHLNDALGLEKRINYVCNHHEQASAIAAEGYVRAGGRLGVVSVTSGPGGTNALTGVIGQWLDSVPVLYLSGQVKKETGVFSYPGSGLRQLGDQEINIIDVVSPVTKYAARVTEPERIKFELQRAIYEATSGRPGPVWLDIPLDVQGAEISPEEMMPFTPEEDRLAPVLNDDSLVPVLDAIRQAERPVIIAGHGIRIAGAEDDFKQLLAVLKIPVVTTFNGFDLVPAQSEYFIGRIGTLGSRAGNFALQNADLVLSIGSRNNIRQVSYSWQSFARCARKIVVDIDRAEIDKPTVKPDIALHCDAGEFVRGLLEMAGRQEMPTQKNWLAWCRERKERYPVVLDSYREPTAKGIHPYYFVEGLTDLLPDDACVVAGNGTACVALFQAGQVKESQRFFWNSGCASMGYGLPAAIGACVARRGTVVCVTGDGSLQMNLQELQTVKHHRMPIILFVLNNQGYRSIEQTQAGFFESRFVGCNNSSGVSFPPCDKLADLYGFSYARIDSINNLAPVLNKVLSLNEPVLCEVVLSKNYVFSPKLSSEKKPDGRIVSKPLEDLFPFLDRDEFMSNMIVPALKES